MSLQVWLPLNGNLDNQGLGDIEVTNNGATIDNSGKIGKCYYFDGNAHYLQFSESVGDLYSGDFSYAVWLKPMDDTRSVICSEYASSGASNIAFELSASRQVRLYWNGSPDISSTGCILPKSQWTHVTITRSGNEAKFYMNGELKYTYTGTLSNRTSTAKIRLGDDYRGGTSVSYMGYMNDFRLYDHALSAKEIKLLSQGLVAHYTLDNMINTSNLIINGYGELGGNIGWTNTNVSTTEIPSEHSEIKASFYTGNMTKDYILLYPDHSYTLEVYIKSSGATSGNTYPSIYPYDADKKFINNYNSLSGFDVSTKTTLKQPLKKGDTVIYANDLSKWNTASNYYYFVAIFGYKNSYGEVYDDLVYTADAPTFGTYSDKSNIDKTNNTITLDAPFTGEDRPIGTAICQSTAGGTFYYPFGGIALSTLSDWVYKTATFTPKDTPRLMAAKYIEYSTYYSTYHAGIRLIDNDVNSSIVYDSSGYCNNGVAHGNLTIAPSAPRYSLSTVFNGTNTYIEADSLPSETISISCWLKTPWTSSSGYRIAIHDKATGLAIGWSDTRMITYVGSSNGGTGSILQTSGIWTANQWHHVVIVKTGNTTRDIYIDGVKMNPSGANYWGGDLNKLNIGNRHINGSYSAYWDGQISDFRAYTTSLSEEDIKELYQSAGSVDNHGNSFMYEYKEE